MENLPQYVANSRKAIISFLSLIVTLGTAAATFSSSLDPKYAALITAVVGAAGQALHYLTPNAPAPGDGTATNPFDISTIDDDEKPQDDWQPAELVTADHIRNSLPPDTTTAPDTTNPANT